MHVPAWDMDDITVKAGLPAFTIWCFLLTMMLKLPRSLADKS